MASFLRINPMLALPSWNSKARLGPWLIVCGLAVVLVAQFLVSIPVAAAILLIGWGSTLSLRELSPGAVRHPLEIVNVATYVSLAAFAFGAQWHPGARIGTVALGVDLLVVAMLGVDFILRLTGRRKA